MIKVLTGIEIEVAPTQQEPRTIAVDLDGTLAVHEEFNPSLIGEPIPAMVERVKQWLNDGFRVVVFTARVSEGDAATMELVQNWITEHIGEPLDVTCRKTPDLEFLIDDKAVSVEKNTGKIHPAILPTELKSTTIDTPDKNMKVR